MTRPSPPQMPRDADERTMLLAFLDLYRFELIDRAHGLSTEQLQTRLPPSSLTLSRLIGHMTAVEYGWFKDVLDNDGAPSIYDDVDWKTDPDAEMTRAQTQTTDELLAEYHEAVADSDHRIAQTLSLDQMSAKTDGSGVGWSLRWILIHMIEEYARHCGHADLIREAIDGDLAR